jgi:NAD(P)-dependent dehydrogenase (short-subunit alcohol dehydrogenase family)
MSSPHDSATTTSPWAMYFQDRVVCVSGGGAGIGAASARGFAAAGAAVVIADVDEASSVPTVQSLKEKGYHVEYLSCDVSDESSVTAVFAWVLDHYGRVDVVHANAGIEWARDSRHTGLADWQKVIAVNLTGVFLFCRAALQAMCAAGEGVVIATSSPHALATVPDASAYTASKGGVHALVRSLALEGAPFGVRVNAVIPGAIDTPMLRREALASSSPQEQMERWAAMHPLGRLGKPEEVANAVMFLASPLASFTTGSALSVDGGLLSAQPSGPSWSYGM